MSPPPRTDTKVFSLVFFEIDSAIDIVPLIKFLFSKYPAGPFHNIVLESLITCLILLIELEPISKIISFFSI